MRAFLIILFTILFGYLITRLVVTYREFRRLDIIDPIFKEKTIKLQEDTSQPFYFEDYEGKG